MSIREYVEINIFLGLTFVKIVNKNDEELIFTTDEGAEYIMYHEQDCSEHVYLEDICGDLDDLLNSPILMAEESYSSKEDDDGSETWTFYNLATIKGYVDLRWYGSSNGYYSECISIVKGK